jgi:hypothetical protein
MDTVDLNTTVGNTLLSLKGKDRGLNLIRQQHHVSFWLDGNIVHELHSILGIILSLAKVIPGLGLYPGVRVRAIPPDRQ